MKNPDGTLFSMPRETESTRAKSFRTSELNSDTTKTSRKYRSSQRRCIFRYGRDFMASSMQAALHMDQSYEKNLELFKNSEFVNIKGLFGITRMMIEGNSEIKNVFPADVASSLWENMYCLKNKH